jgi:putative transposase
MKGKRFTTEEKIRILRDTDQRGSITETCKEFNISDVTFHRWKRQFGQMDLNEGRRLKELQKENTELKKMLADALLAKPVLEYVVEKNYEPGAQEAGGASRRPGRTVLQVGGVPDPAPGALDLPGSRRIVQGGPFFCRRCQKPLFTGAEIANEPSPAEIAESQGVAQFCQALFERSIDLTNYNLMADLPFWTGAVSEDQSDIVSCRDR